MNKSGRRLGVVSVVVFLHLGAMAVTSDYRVSVVVQTGGTLSAIDTYTSINNQRKVALTGRDSTGSRVFVCTETGQLSAVSFTGSSSRTFLGASINNESPAQTASRDQVSGSPPTYFERKWSETGSFTVVGRSPTHYDSAQSFVDVNDSGVVAFMALTGGSLNTSLFAGTAEPPTQLASWGGTVSIRPQISNNNLIVVRDNTNRILLYPYPAGTPIFIAGTSNGFTTTGAWPGISADGSVVSFYGDRGNGPGIFASVRRADGTWQLIPVSGDGLEPAGGFTAFDPNQRVGVIADGDVSVEKHFRLVFSGTKGGLAGIYTVGGRYRDGGTVSPPCPPRLVVQINDQLAGKTVSSFFLYDPFNANADIAFRVGFSDGSAGVAIAKPFKFIDCVPDAKQLDPTWASIAYDHYYGTVSADNDGDGSVDEDDKDGIDNDGDGTKDEDRPDNIGRWGCYLTSCVDIINYYGKLTGFSTDPQTLNTWLRNNHGYSGPRVIPARCADYARLNGVTMYFEGSATTPNNATVDSYLCRQDPVMLRVSNNGHSVVATGQVDLDGTQTYALADPGHSNPQYKTLGPYGGYQGMRLFSSRRTTQCTPLLPTANGTAVLDFSTQFPAHLLVRDPQERQTGFDPAFGRAYSDAPRSSYEKESTEDPEDPTYRSPEFRIFSDPDPVTGIYATQVIGESTGPYTVRFFATDDSGGTSTSEQSGTTSPGKIDVWNVGVSRATGVTSATLVASCQSLVGLPVLTVTKTQLLWPPVANASGYDVARGDLGSLRATGGDFTTSTTSCVASNTAATQVPFPDTPGTGAGIWILLRARNCGGPGTYDANLSAQARSRDPGLNAATPGCP